MSTKELITMLTWHDVTVPDAKEVFLGAKDAPTDHWGFKIEGTTPESMQELVDCMHQYGKTVYIEVLAMDEPGCLRAAKLCAAYKVDHVLGAVYYESVAKVLADAGIAYSPFVGLAADSRLRGTVDSIVEKAKEAEAKNIYGINLSAFRYREGDPVELLKAMDAAVTKPFSIAGSVDCYEKLDVIKRLKNLYGFTIGGAFFEKKFGETFSEQIKAVTDYLKA